MVCTIFRKTGVLLFCLGLLASCENFMESGAFQSGIEEKVDYANSASHIIFVNAADGTGAFIQGGGTQSLKKTDSFDVEFNVNSSYKFIRWMAVDRNNTTLSKESYINFSDPESLKTKVTLLSDCDNILIRPYCNSYLEVSSFSPEYKENGVEFNSEIKITFSDYLEESTFSFTNEEIKNLAISDENLLKTTTFDGVEYTYGYIRNSKTYFKNIEIYSSLNSGSILHYFESPKIINGKTLYLAFKKDKYDEFKSALNGRTDEITVTLSRDITDIRSMSFPENYSALSYTYKINSEIIADSASAEILFSIDEGEGTISPKGTNTIYTGLNYDLIFTPSSDYYFHNWGIFYAVNGSPLPYADQIVQIKDKENTQTKFTLSTAISGIMIKPVCSKRSTVSFTSPYGTGIPARTNIVVYFTQQMETEDLRWSFSDIQDFPVREILRDGDNQIYGYISTSGSHIWKNIEIVSSAGENLLPKFGYAEFDSNDTSKMYINATSPLAAGTVVYVRINKAIRNEQHIPCGEDGDFIEFSYMIQ